MQTSIVKNLPESTVMKPRAITAPVKTVSLECDMAIMAAMKNDLSPISEIMITDRDATTAWTKLMSISDWSSFGAELESKLAGTYNKNTIIFHPYPTSE